MEFSAKKNTQTMMRVVCLDEELLCEYQRVSMGVDTMFVSQKGQPLFVSHVNWVRSSDPQEDISFWKSKGSVHTPHGLCEVTRGSTVSVAFEPARPGSPLPA